MPMPPGAMASPNPNNPKPNASPVGALAGPMAFGAANPYIQQMMFNMQAQAATATPQRPLLSPNPNPNPNPKPKPNPSPNANPNPNPSPNPNPNNGSR